MPDSADFRKQALKCRALAMEADDRTAAALRMLANDYDEQARLLKGKPKPRPVRSPGD